MKRFTYSGTPLGKMMMEVVAACAPATKVNRRADTNFIATRTGTRSCSFGLVDWVDRDRRESHIRKCTLTTPVVSLPAAMRSALVRYQFHNGYLMFLIAIPHAKIVCSYS